MVSMHVTQLSVHTQIAQCILIIIIQKDSVAYLHTDSLLPIIL